MALRWDDRCEHQSAVARGQAHLSDTALSYGIRAEMADGAGLSLRVAARRAQLNAPLLERHEYVQVRRAAAQALGNHLKNAP